MQDLLDRVLKNKKYFRTALLCIIFFSFILNIILCYAGLYSISADESGRTIDAYKWITGNYKGTPTWLPFYTILIGYSLTLLPDLFITPRIIISISGILAFISFIWLTNELFKDRYITLLSSLIALFFPSRVVLSSVPLTESIFFFFVFTGIAFFTRWLNNKNNNLLFFSALSFALSSSVRYEGWVFAAAFILVLIIFKRLKRGSIKPKIIIAVILISSAFPVYWLIYQADAAGSPLQFFYDVNRNYERSQGISFFSIVKNNYLTRFIHHNLIYLCFPGLIILGHLFLRDSRIRKWVSLPVIAFIPLVLISFTGRGIPTHNIWRTPELWNILLIPFTAYFFRNINSFDIQYLRNLKRGAVPLILIVILIYYSFHISKFKHEFGFSKEELQIGRYIDKNLIQPDNDSKILIKVPDWSFLHIIAASNNPENFIKNSESGDPSIRKNLTITDSSTTNLNELTKKNIKYLMAKTPELKNKINRDTLFEGKKKFNDWHLYKIIRKD
jgi:hypothetical protein